LIDQLRTSVMNRALWCGMLVASGIQKSQVFSRLSLDSSADRASDDKPSSLDCTTDSKTC